MLRATAFNRATDELWVPLVEEAFVQADTRLPASSVKSLRFEMGLEKSFGDAIRTAAKRCYCIWKGAPDPQSTEITLDQTVADGDCKPLAGGEVDHRKGVGFRAEFRQVPRAYPMPKRSIKQ